MTRIQVQPGTRYIYQQEIWSVRQGLADQQFQVENLSTGEIEDVSYSEILAAWSHGELRFEVRGPNAVPEFRIPGSKHVMKKKISPVYLTAFGQKRGDVTNWCWQSTSCME